MKKDNSYTEKLAGLVYNFLVVMFWIFVSVIGFAILLGVFI